MKIGIGFGLTFGVITTLGLLVGLYATTGSQVVVIGGILSIAVADALSDALGIHVSQESKKRAPNQTEVWAATIATFVAKFLFAMTFLLPVIFLELRTAVIVSVIWGCLATILFTWYLNRKKKEKYFAIVQHLFLTVFVIVLTYFLGRWIAFIFQ